MTKYKRYLIAGWFDLMGIEVGVAYMRYYQASCKCDYAWHRPR